MWSCMYSNELTVVINYRVMITVSLEIEHVIALITRIGIEFDSIMSATHLDVFMQEKHGRQENYMF